MKPYVAYLSTWQKFKFSLEAQREIIMQYASVDGVEMISGYIEAESGKKTANRPRRYGVLQDQLLYSRGGQTGQTKA